MVQVSSLSSGDLCVPPGDDEWDTARCGARAWRPVQVCLKGDGHVPTLTAVFPSSSEARLPPGLLLILRRLLLRGVRITELMGRGAGPVGDAGGETVISPGETTPGGQNEDDQ